MPLTAVNGLAHSDPDGSRTATVPEPIAISEPGATSAESDMMTRAGSIAEMADAVLSTTSTREPLCSRS